MIKLLSRWSVGWVMVVLSIRALAQPVATTRPVEPGRWDLLAHGSKDRLWYAFTTSAGGQPQCIVREREMQHSEWHDLRILPPRIIALGDMGGELVAALDHGEWKFISQDQFTSGHSLPDRGEILALAGNGGTLWAIGFGAGAMPVTLGTTQPATRPTSMPTTSPETLQLYKLASGGWAHVASLPGNVRTAVGDELAMIITENAPIIAYKDSADIARIKRLNPSSPDKWIDAGVMKTSFIIRKVKLMTARDKIIGWSAGESGVGSFFFPGVDLQVPWREQPLSVPPGVDVVDSSVAAAHDELHLFVIRADEKFYEQKYDLAGRLTPDSMAALVQPSHPNQTGAMEMLNWGLLGLLMIVTLTAANKGGPVQVVQINKVELALAPFSLRLAAGLIDLWPFFVANALIGLHYRSGLKPSQFYSERFGQMALLFAVTAYFLHTLVAELLVGRSLGKMLVGLRVVGLNGERAPAGAILLRNLMRLIEVPGMIGVPLLAMLFNPLRQRLGDFAAGTVVVAKLPPKEKRQAPQVLDD